MVSPSVRRMAWGFAAVLPRYWPILQASQSWLKATLRRASMQALQEPWCC